MSNTLTFLSLSWFLLSVLGQLSPQLCVWGLPHILCLLHTISSCCVTGVFGMQESALLSLHSLPSKTMVFLWIQIDLASNAKLSLDSIFLSHLGSLCLHR